MRSSTIIWIVVIILVILGAWYWYSTMSPPGTTTPSPSAGLNGSPNQGNLGQPDTGTPQQPSAAPTAVIELATDAKLGKMLVATNGMTLYTYSKDKAGVSNCTGTCAANWPPYTVAAGTTMNALAGITGALGVIARADGTTQVTYNGKPVYFYKDDVKAGDTNGQAVGGVWYVVKP